MVKSQKLKKKTSYTQTPKKNKRNSDKYPALNPALNLKTRTDLLDYDYLNKLDEKELEWLNKFTEEYVNASFNTEKPRKNIHKTKAYRKDCYDRNNARNRDVLTRQRASNKNLYLEDIKSKGYSEENKMEARIELKRMGIIDNRGNIKRRKKTNP